MSIVSAPVTPAREAALPRSARTLIAGVLGGAALGVAARAWMRLIAGDPEFSWSGTIFIAMTFTIFGLVQAIVAAARRRVRRRAAHAAMRVVGSMGLVPLFLGAGMVMLPTVVAGGVAATRREWRVWPRALCAVVAAAPIAFVVHGLVVELGWSWRALAGTLGLVALYGTIVRAAEPTFRPNPGAASQPAAAAGGRRSATSRLDAISSSSRVVGHGG